MANSPIKFKVEIEGWKEIARKLKGDELLAGPWTAAMNAAAEAALNAWKGASAVGQTGQMRAKMLSKVQAKPVPLWLAVRSTATRSSKRYKRYRYPNRLEYDPRSRHKGKLKAALDGAMGRIQSILDAAAGRVEAKWRA